VKVAIRAVRFVPNGTVTAMVFAVSLITPVNAGIIKLKEVIALDTFNRIGVVVVVVAVKVVSVVVGVVVWIDVCLVVALVQADTRIMANIMMIDIMDETMFLFFI